MLPITWNIGRFQAQKIITLPIISKINFRSISSLQRVACPVSPPDNPMTKSTTSVGWTESLPSCWFFDKTWPKPAYAPFSNFAFNVSISVRILGPESKHTIYSMDSLGRFWYYSRATQGPHCCMSTFRRTENSYRGLDIWRKVLGSLVYTLPKVLQPIRVLRSLHKVTT